MTARGRSNNDWDLMKEDYNNSFHDDDDSGGIQFDHCRLYILNIPKGLSEEGLRTAFGKYGTLTEVYVSKDPSKKYALVKYETPGEAKLAMTKLNNTDPMKLHISIARKTRAKKDNNNYSRDNTDRNYVNGPSKRSIREDASVSSKRSSRVHEEINGDEMNESLHTLDDNMQDPDIEIKSLQLELQRLQVQEQTMLLRQQLFQLEAARKKKLTQSTTSNRCILPDGRIVVRNVNERSLESRDVEGSFAAGAGDSRGCACVVCGTTADTFCSRCGLTPYCSARCQRRDWLDRHRAVCHNLARMAGKVDTSGADQISAEKDVIPQAAPLRQPHSPAAKPQRKEVEAMPDLSGPKKPPLNTHSRQDSRSCANRGPRNFNNSKLKSGQGQDQRRPKNQGRSEKDEDWGSTNIKTATPAPAEPAAAPLPALRAPASLADATPAKGGSKLVPKNYLIELLSPGDTVLLSVEGDATDCRSPRPGFVCLSMHEQFEAQYQDLCEQYTVDCDADTVDVTPAPGETFSYLNPSDGGWYRARRLSPALAALLDAGRLAPLAPADTLRRLPPRYRPPPEFCCLLTAAAVQVGDNLKCKLITKTADGFKVSLSHVESDAAAGEGEVSRWVPRVEYPAPVAPPPVAGVPAPVPEVPRPDLVNDSKVLLVDATAFDRAFVRSSDRADQRRFDQVLEEVVMYARTAAPLKEPPVKGQVVIGKFTDGLFYRALVKRTNVKQNKYLLEYIEFGNPEITSLDNLYPCPPQLQLSAQPTVASLVTLQCKCTSPFTQPAVEYLDALKDGLDELTLTIPSGAKSAASGSAVCLLHVKTNESVNRKLERLCTPDWKKLEEKGTDVVELKPMMFSDLECLELPAGGCELDVLDVSALAEGSVSGCQSGLPHQAHVLTTLTEQMAEYCSSELGREPYLPKFEELCVARFLPYPQWFRAVLIEQTPGSGTARVCYVDYGNVAEVPVVHLRKMLPEFVRGQPALASHLEIKDFPKNPTPEMLARAVEHMKINDEGRGTLAVTRCERQEVGLYVVHAPELLRAMAGQ